MIPENNISFAASIIGSVYLSVKCIEQINQRPGNDISMANMCNYYMLGVSVAIIASVLKHLINPI